VSHIDAPRLDLKQNPLYEEVDIVFLKTHYYGGIKKYQWLARPLAIHGTVLTRAGKTVDIHVGDDDTDPVFAISDLLPHLSRKVQANKKVSEAFQGEKLNLMVGSLPIGDDETKERFKLAILEHLFSTYGLIEEDLVSAEIEVVPAGRARDVGWDRGLVGAYGQDDRVCAYASLEAVVDLAKPARTAVVLFMDKEEIGSDGATGAKSRFLEDFVSELFEKTGQEATEKAVRTCLMNTWALSADVNGALDPDYQEVHEERNAAKLGYGVCITKFTGSGGKYGSSDANAEYLGHIRKIFNENNVVWQTGELGKVDEGGGGTIAKFLAVYGMEVLDCGTPLLSMHSPFEIASKGDIYMTFKAYCAFLESQ
jgi:aspartyl aminopeptidase